MHKNDSFGHENKEEEKAADSVLINKSTAERSRPESQVLLGEEQKEAHGEYRLLEEEKRGIENRGAKEEERVEEKNASEAKREVFDQTEFLKGSINDENDYLS